MIKRIVICIGNDISNHSLQHFVAKNINKFPANVVFEPESLIVPACAGEAGYNTILFRPYAPFDLTKTKEAFGGAPAEGTVGGPDGKTLCLFRRVFAFYPGQIEKLRNQLAVDFPHATQHIFWPVSRVDRDFASLYAFHCLFSAASWPNTWSMDFLAKISGKGRAFAKMQELYGREAISIEIDNGTPACTKNIREKFLALLLGNNTTSSRESFDFSPPAWNLFLPPEFLLVSRTAELVKGVQYVDGATIPWSTQAQYFTASAGYSSPYSLLGDTIYQQIITRHASATAFFEKQVGRGALFEAWRPQGKPEPLMSITTEIAKNVLHRVDRDFARQFFENINAYQEVYSGYNARLCKQILKGMFSTRPVIRRGEPKVSVLTTSYNHCKFIEKTMQSVLEQNTDFPVQHIIADDGSTDGTQDIILEYAAKYPSIVPVFQRKNTGGSSNFFGMFEMARTPYVAICEGDDYFTDADKLQMQADMLDAHPDYALCAHLVRVVYENNVKPERIYPPLEMLPRGLQPCYTLDDLFEFNFIQTNSVMYRWRFTQGMPAWFNNRVLPADWYWHLIHAELGKVGFINKVMSAYRRHENAVYYTAEVNVKQHHHKYGKRELHFYDVINKHFKGKFQAKINNFAIGVFAETAFYCNEIDDYSKLQELVDSYPDFAALFFASLPALSDVNEVG